MSQDAPTPPFGNQFGFVGYTLPAQQPQGSQGLSSWSAAAQRVNHLQTEELAEKKRKEEAEAEESRRTAALWARAEKFVGQFLDAMRRHGNPGLQTKYRRTNWLGLGGDKEVSWSEWTPRGSLWLTLDGKWQLATYSDNDGRAYADWQLGHVYSEEWTDDRYEPTDEDELTQLQESLAYVLLKYGVPIPQG